MADASSIQLWAESMTRPEPAMPFDAAKKAFYDYLAPILTARRDQPGDDLISYMITADIGGRMLDEQEALAISTQILIAGVDTVVNFLGFAMLFLARNPDARHALAADPESILQATHELFRRFGLVTVAREVRHDMDYRGVQLKAGDVIALPTEVHGIDDHANADPLRVDFDRKRARHSAFGSGPHMCPGQELARVEVAITIEEWLERIPDFEDAGEADTHCGGGIVGSIKRLVLKWETK
jgi:cytochrome P450